MYKIVVIEAFKKGLGSSIERLQREFPEIGEVQVYLLTSKPQLMGVPDSVRVIQCDYSKEQLALAFHQIGQGVKTVICRGDMYIQYLRRILPYLSADAFVASEKSLEAATNKRLMRESFMHGAPEITPLFVKVDDTTAATIEYVAATLSFPVIIKPASLASSLMIQKCDNIDQLAAALKATFSTISSVYEREGRHEQPEVIVEEFLEGDFYSIDSYVLDESSVYHCPLVAYLPAKSIGIDDFFLYKRWTPVDIPAADALAAQKATEKAIKALGLTYTSTHTELIRTNNGWKIIEIGPRIGRFRNSMYKAAYGFDHGYNDLLIHAGMKPRISSNEIAYSVAYSIYPQQEGKLLSIAGINDLPDHVDNIIYQKVSAHPGIGVKQAKHGGHALAEIVFADQSSQRFAEQCAWFEESVFADVQPETK